VVLADQAGAQLRATLAALAAQDYPTLRTLVMDSGSDDDVAATAASEAPDALVLRFPPGTAVLGAANDVRRLVEGAAFYLFLANGAVLETGSITALVEEAYRSNAGVVGPKILDPSDPTRILDVGAAIDKFAVAAPFAEVGERDQEQHDSVRDVFSLLGAALLVRADLFEALDGFDATLAPDAAVLDLCWRSHLVGARVMVVPAARVHLRGAEIGRAHV
jgi:GT2 family glycosyltransferase